MIKIYRSDTGQFVLVHDATKTVIIDDELSRAYEKMQTYIEENHPEAAALTASLPFDQSGRSSRDTPALVRYGLLFFLVLLPFLWLGILHYSLGSLIDEVMMNRDAPATLQDAPAAEPEPELAEDLPETGL